MTRLLLSLLATASLSAAAATQTFTGVITDSMCAMLGHPTECPHGSPIPPGPCCPPR